MDVSDSIEKILELYSHALIEVKLNELEESKEIKKWDWYYCNSWFIKSREYEITFNNGRKMNRYLYDKEKL